ncbi:hypothetical protein A6R68_16252 [Neotoma lepida]|uniref:Galanin peptides n=1 Tax=Neotoma lepida TaxID=56216 RepID=A0A1A6HI60_NEOLE|nr:hypothetical protein A6R68_16252 [Neotoma lepida]
MRDPGDIASLFWGFHILALCWWSSCVWSSPGAGNGISHSDSRLSHSGLQTDAIDNHRSFSDKHGLTGKRELQLEVEEGRPGSIDGPLPDSNIVRTIMEFLSFLHLKEAGALDSLPGLPLATSSEDLEQS